MRIALPIFFLVIIFSCRKEDFTTDGAARLSLSEDTLHFDTVFTTTGSTSQLFKIFNSNKEGIRISSIKLAGGAASPFKINADGVPGPLVNGIEVKGGDSAYVFVTVSINPNTANLPFVVRDSIEIEYNGNKNKLQLEAYGQNAHFLRGKVITGTETWNNDLPYVILDGLLIQQNAQLNINKGCKIYVHADAPMLVDGTLNVQGEKWDSTRVVFASDRIDDPYRDFPAGWPGIFFMANSKNSVLNFAIVKNAYQAVALEESNISPKLTLTETIIDNAYDAGIIAANSSLTARNVLISNCGKNVVLTKGGNYSFTHCTVATFGSSYIQHKDPVLYLSNFSTLNNVATAYPLNANFRNCIFWGDANGIVENEVVTAKNNNAAFNVSFENVLWRVKTTPANTTVTAAINDIDPQFDSINTAKRYFDFRLKEGSPAINKGMNAGVMLDLDGKPRPVGLPDLGCYEKQ